MGMNSPSRVRQSLSSNQEVPTLDSLLGLPSVGTQIFPVADGLSDYHACIPVETTVIVSGLKKISSSWVRKLFVTIYFINWLMITALLKRYCFIYFPFIVSWSQHKPASTACCSPRMWRLEIRPVSSILAICEMVTHYFPCSTASANVSSDVDFSSHRYVVFNWDG